MRIDFCLQNRAQTRSKMEIDVALEREHIHPFVICFLESHSEMVLPPIAYSKMEPPPAVPLRSGRENFARRLHPLALHPFLLLDRAPLKRDKVDILRAVEFCTRERTPEQLLSANAELERFQRLEQSEVIAGFARGLEFRARELLREPPAGLAQSAFAGARLVDQSLQGAHVLLDIALELLKKIAERFAFMPFNQMIEHLERGGRAREMVVHICSEVVHVDLSWISRGQGYS